MGALALPQIREYLDLLAPGSGALWDDLGARPAGTVSSPYGDATVVYDDEGVPHIEADDERALQYAHGYVQGYDRLFQLDLFRRQLRGRLSEVAGEATVETDEFHRRMDFERAAAASREAVEGSETEGILEAFAKGVTASSRDNAAPLETSLLSYEIDPWTVTDTLLIEKLMGWELTGRFRTLRRVALTEEFESDVVSDLYPSRYDHDVPIIDSTSGSHHDSVHSQQTISPETATWFSSFESPPGLGSNSWVVGGEHTASDGPLLANDPHLALSSPPVWYEVGLETPAFRTRGVTFPGTPFVVIGRNDQASWGFTNVPADVMDFYTYEVDDDQYRIGDDWYDFEIEHQVVPVSGASNRELELRFTEQGPYFERYGSEIAVQWTGLGGTRTVSAVRALQFVEDHTSLIEALSDWDLPPQNLVYADAGGHTRYHIVGKIPIRYTDGEAVRADRVFDGTAGEGQWPGFTPYGQSTWEGFIPLEELPQVVDPDVLSTANQRVMNDPPAYLAEVHSPPFRAKRVADRLEEATIEGHLEIDDMATIQQDIYDELAALLVPDILEYVEDPDEPLEAARSALSAWDYKMSVDAWAPVVFELWLGLFRERVFIDPLAEVGFDEDDVPSDWILATLDGDHPWFDIVGSRDEHLTAAFEEAAELSQSYDDFGELQQTEINHPFEVGFLNYPRKPMPGSGRTLKNYRREALVGTGWQQIVDHGSDESVGRLAGGNVGRVLSPHYADQLQAWIDGEYKSIDWSPAPTRRLEFSGESP